MTVHEPIIVPTEQKIWQFRVKDFLLLEESGAFADSAKAELLDGEIWVLNAIHSRHASVQAELQGRLWAALGKGNGDLRTYVTPSVDMGDRSLPEPDLVVAEPHSEGFLPFAKVRLIIEVADTTLDIDLGRKQQLYAAAGIPEYWVADVNARVIHQMWAPEGQGYESRRKVDFGADVTSETIRGVQIITDAL